MITKKLIKQLVVEFINNKHNIFSNTKRKMSAIEDKTIDVLHAELSKESFINAQEVKWKVEDIMQRAIELADKIGFVRITYDLILESNK